MFIVKTCFYSWLKFNTYICSTTHERPSFSFFTSQSTVRYSYNHSVVLLSQQLSLGKTLQCLCLLSSQTVRDWGYEWSHKLYEDSYRADMILTLRETASERWMKYRRYPVTQAHHVFITQAWIWRTINPKVESA